MARIDSITIGKGKGSLGNVTLRETKDGTIASQKISKGTQKIGTYNQTVRRVMLSNLVNAYQGLMRLSDAGMKVAFTNKPQNESDFNAFVRMNMAKSDVSKVKLTKEEAAANVIVPAPFVLTDGDLLAPINLINTYGATSPNMGKFSMGGSVADMGDVAANLIANWGFKDGDVVTFVGMPLEQSRTPFVVKQIVVNSLSEEDLPDWIGADGKITLMPNTFVSAATIIRGRVETSGYKVSPSTLGDVVAIDFEDADDYELHISKAYEQLAVQSYGYKLQPFLQSGENAAGGPQPGPVPPSAVHVTFALDPEDAGTYTVNGEHKPVGEYEWPYGAELEIGFEAASGFIFGGWKNRSETDPDIVVVVTADTTIEAIALEE